ncbi:hypothetical protein F4557_002882 [Actinomadura catellatispora]|uniref:Uncharacterized protein n=1 Tax=Actinomadura livida TaxID=79909 RepID=A0A7W7ICN5_9ACTN|nr:hypothetical protein [Actinomadura catellatispora]
MSSGHPRADTAGVPDRYGLPCRPAAGTGPSEDVIAGALIPD